MPSLGVITWNSLGESSARVNDLRNIINWLNGQHRRIDLILIQEAEKKPGGALYNFLKTVGGFEVFHSSEFDHQSVRDVGIEKGYLMAVSTGSFITPVRKRSRPRILRYETSSRLTRRYTTIKKTRTRTSTKINHRIRNSVLGARRPYGAMKMKLRNSSVRVNVFNWHVSLKQHHLHDVHGTIKGPGYRRSLRYFEESEELESVKTKDLTILAGDLNLTAQDLINELKTWEGIGHHYDHVLVKDRGGTTTFTNAYDWATTSDHNAVYVQVNF